MQASDSIAHTNSMKPSGENEIQAAKRDVSFAEAFRFWLKFLSF